MIILILIMFIISIMITMWPLRRLRLWTSRALTRASSHGQFSSIQSSTCQSDGLECQSHGLSEAGNVL